MLTETPDPTGARPGGSPHAATVAAVEACWHCGAAVPPRTRWRAPVAGEERAFCCAGCLAVDRTIAGAGLDRYYLSRSGPLPPALDGDERPVAWNAAAATAGHVRTLPDGRREVSLLLEIHPAWHLGCSASSLTDGWFRPKRSCRPVDTSPPRMYNTVRFCLSSKNR